MRTHNGTKRGTARWLVMTAAIALTFGGLGLAWSTVSAGEPTLSASQSGGTQSTAPAATSRKGLDITLRSQPDPPKTGENRFDVTVKGADGKPVADADVSVVFVMPAMPAMKMPEMRNEAKLRSAGGGKYTGTGNVMMAGRWEVTVLVKQKGKEIGQKKVTVTAQ